MKSHNLLRTPETITALDPRGGKNCTPGDAYKILESIRLHARVPNRVAEIVETAKNLSLYACFVHDFHASACLTGFVALEVALKEKWRAVYKQEPGANYQMLKSLLTHAVAKKWIRINAFAWARSNAAYNARVKALNQMHVSHPAGGSDPPVINDSLIEGELASYASWVAEWADAAKELRNGHAHGKRVKLHQSHGQLRLVADAINGMF
jgi:hypothetical protein